MSVKVILNAQAVRALVKDEPLLVELGKTAAAQVAEQLGRKLVRERIETAVLDHLRSMAIGTSAWRPKLSSQLQGLMNDYAKSVVDKHAEQVTSAAFQKEVRTLVREAVALEIAQARTSLAGEIDKLIRERFAAAFGGKG